MDADEALSIAKKLYKQLLDQRSEVVEFDDYFRGEQPLAFASREWSDFHKDRYKGFADNWCAPVASAPAERLGIIGLRVGNSKRQPAGLKRVWGDWIASDGESQSSQGFLESIVARRSHTIVWGNNDGESEFTWEHPSQVTVGYAANNPRNYVAAIKSYVDDDTEFLTLYEPEHLWKWRRKVTQVSVHQGRTESGLHVVGATANLTDDATDWQPYQPKSDDVWPLPNPLGEVNVVEWPNRPLLGNEPMSDIEGTKAMQDAVNLLWAYLFGAADHASMPARVVLGQDQPKVPILDSNGNRVGEKPIELKELQQGRLLWLTGQKTKIGQWDAAKLEVFTGVIEQAISHIAAQTRTPSHYLINSGNVPAAGYELAEAGLVKRVEEFQMFSSSPARRHFRLMALARGESGLAEQLKTATIDWKHAGVRSEAQMADALIKKRDVGYPFEYLLEEDGKSPSEIKRIMEMVRDEQADPYLGRLNAKGAADDGAEPSTVGS